MKLTTQQLTDEVQKLRASQSNVHLSTGTCWNHAQMGAILERYARYGELIKADITVEHTPTRNGYHYQIWHYELLNPEDRKNDEYGIAGMSGPDFRPERKG